MQTKNYNYIKSIIAMVEDQSIKDKEFQSELIDHYCTYYESKCDQLVHEELIEKISESLRNKDLIPRKSNNNMYKNGLIFASLILLTWTIVSPPNAPAYLNQADSKMAIVDLDDEPPYGSPLEDLDLKISAKYGNMMHPIMKVVKFHKGIDLRAPEGTKVISVAEGKVVESSYNKKKGNYIIIQHDDEYQTKYFHLKERAVEQGDIIKKGQRIGEVGSTGLSTGPHLHYEIIKNGKTIDPKDFVTA